MVDVVKGRDPATARACGFVDEGFLNSACGDQASGNAYGINARINVAGLRYVCFSSGEPAVQRCDFSAAQAGGEGGALSVGTFGIKRSDAWVQVRCP